MHRPQSDIRLSFDDEFCLALEYHLCRTFVNHNDERLKRFWCDGVKMPHYDSQLSKVNLIRTAEVIKEAWMGFNGQEIYGMYIKMGPKAMKACLPIACPTKHPKTGSLLIQIPNRPNYS